LSADILISFGLIKIDRKFNNEYDELALPTPYNIYAKSIRSTNYYGLNSNATNISGSLTLGVAYQLFE
jgi:hypothetical protein